MAGNLEGVTSKLLWGVGLGGSLTFIVITAYGSAPTIEDSLESQEFQLISKLADKLTLYERSFKRNRNFLINMDLDGFMNDNTVDDEGTIALNVGCDTNLKRRHFFVSLDDYKKFCALSMGDVLWLEKNKGLEKVMDEAGWKSHVLENGNLQKFQNHFFPRFQLTGHGDKKRDYLTGKNGCEGELSEPYSWKNRNIREIIRDNCLERKK